MTKKKLPPGHVDVSPATIRILHGDPPPPPEFEKPQAYNPIAVTRHSTLKPGDGDIIVPRREGSDHSRIKSRGYPC